MPTSMRSRPSRATGPAGRHTPGPPEPSSALNARISATREPAGAQAAGEPSRTTTWWTAPHASAVGLAAAGAVGLGLGLYFDARSNSAASDAGSLRSALAGQCAGHAVAPGCAMLRDKIAEVHTDGTSQTLRLPLVRLPPSARR